MTGDPSDLSKFFWLPVPAHEWGEPLTWEEAQLAAGLADLPLSYGPFMISTVSGQTVQLVRNRYYYRAAEGLPLLDEVTLQVAPDRETAITALRDGACDVVDTSFALENDPQWVSSLEAALDIQVVGTPTGSWTQLVFGIKPASYDDYYTPAYGDRPDFFGDERVRQAVAACLDRDTLLREGTSGLGTVWSSFLSPTESQLADGEGLVYDPEKGRAFLEAAGWRDHDLNPATPLQAWEVSTVPTGTLFSVSLLVGPSQEHQALASSIQTSLGACGIEVQVEQLSLETLYAPGPGGPLFGRDFDLALVAWQPGFDLDCGLYTSRQVPSIDNQWIGTNIAGFEERSYDAACAEAGLSLPDQRSAATRAAEAVYLESLPSVPLYGYQNVMAFRGGICGDLVVETADSFFESLETAMGDKNCP